MPPRFSWAAVMRITSFRTSRPRRRHRLHTQGTDNPVAKSKYIGCSSRSEARRPASAGDRHRKAGSWRARKVVTERPTLSRRSHQGDGHHSAPKSMDFTRANGPDAGKRCARSRVPQPDEYVIVFAPAMGTPRTLDSKPGSGTFIHVWKRRSSPAFSRRRRQRTRGANRADNVAFTARMPMSGPTPSRARRQPPQGVVQSQIANAAVAVAISDLTVPLHRDRPAALRRRPRDRRAAAPWVAFHDAVFARGLISSTPEYNRSVPGAQERDRRRLAAGWQKACGRQAYAVIQRHLGMLGAFGVTAICGGRSCSSSMPAMQRPKTYIGQVAPMFDDQGTLTNASTARLPREVHGRVRQSGSARRLQRNGRRTARHQQ